MTEAYLALELRLLLLRHGRAAVLSALARLGEVSEDDLERELAHCEERSSRATARSPRATIPVKREDAEKLAADRAHVGRLASLYQAKLFLPSLRDIRAFLDAHGRSASVKSRDAVYPRVVVALSSLPDEELVRLEHAHSSSRDPGAFSLLAGEIMNPSRPR